jgi:DNA-binding IclR family transcriptional regulator
MQPAMTQTLTESLDELAMESTLQATPSPALGATASNSLSSVGKSLQILNAFGGSGMVLGVSQIAERADIPRSTAHRLLAVLVAHGFVQRHDNRYMLGRLVFELGNQIADARPNSLREKAMPFMVDLYGQTGATVHLGVLDRADVLYIEKIYGHATLPLPSRVGGRVPALCTALGKALIAHGDPAQQRAALEDPIPRLTPQTVVNRGILEKQLEHVRTHGYAVDLAGASTSAQCLAAPILDANNRAAAAISVSFSVTAVVPPAVTAHLLRAARGIGRATNI